jgi:hypothetical protein
VNDQETEKSALYSKMGAKRKKKNQEELDGQSIAFMRREIHAKFWW